jgi:hypothetical protein
MQHYGGSFMSVVDTRLQESWENEQWSASKSMNSEVLPTWMSWNQEVVWGYDIDLYAFVNTIQYLKDHCQFCLS